MLDIDKLISDCDNNMITTEGFLDKIKNKEKVELSDEDYEKFCLPIIKNLYNKCINEGRKILNKPEHKLAKKGFRISQAPNSDYMTDDNRTNILVSLFDWDLWKVYPDARTRTQDGDTDEFTNLYNELANKCNEIINEYFKFQETKKKKYTGDGGDWDSGDIEMQIPIKLLIKK